MSGYLSRLVARSLGTADLVRPVIAPLYADWRREPSITADRGAIDDGLEVHEIREAEPTRAPVARSPRATGSPMADGGDPPPAARPLLRASAPVPSPEPPRAEPQSTPPRSTAGTIALPEAAPIDTPSVARRRSQTARPRSPEPIARVTVPASSTVNVPDDHPAPRPAPKRPTRIDAATAILVDPAETPRDRPTTPRGTPDRPALLTPTTPAIVAPPVVARSGPFTGVSQAPGRSNPASTPDDRERTVEITIGRIEIRAVPGTAPAAAPVATRRTSMSLEAYLLARAREGRA
jgi:hypothetical protein